jgi:hypothetical protein
VEDATTIQITRTVRDQLKTLGRKGETYAEIIGRLLESSKPRVKA